MLGDAVTKSLRALEKFTVDIAKPPKPGAFAKFDPRGAKPGSKLPGTCDANFGTWMTYPSTKSSLRNLDERRDHRREGATLTWLRDFRCQHLNTALSRTSMANKTWTELAKNANPSLGVLVRTVARNRSPQARQNWSALCGAWAA